MRSLRLRGPWMSTHAGAGGLIGYSLGRGACDSTTAVPVRGRILILRDAVSCMYFMPCALADLEPGNSFVGYVCGWLARSYS